ncbi:HNH endonuclease signature motif containing protein [Nocardioides piscis]|uniref:HNH endonuclease n=1 Tax=Nocardioides piscis TaxID=2714938 RepID=A0A6G7YHX2_9ACTN|nr:HNH endonuclease signature motif containing protein [Nocardioides piscis]QIK76231.1 hypothetical protein G7071_13130 [Nocardioides piscis]
MTSTATHPSSTRNSRSVLDRAVAARSARRRAEAAELTAALDWAHAHPAVSTGHAASWTGSPTALWGERTISLAGVGAPLVAEFAPVEYAGAVGISHEAANALIGDALDLAHRLPRLWALVHELRVPASLARLAAQESRDLDVDAAAHADRLLAWQPTRLNPHRIGVLVQEARLYADPDRAHADHDSALASRRVDVQHDAGAPSTSQVHMTLDTADAEAFDDTVSAMAATLGALGDPQDLDVRRARSVGILADPQRALDLLAVVDRETGALDDGETSPAAEDAGFTPSSPYRRAPAHASGSPSLVLHVTASDLLDPLRPGQGGVATSRLGPVLLERLARWLVGAHVTVRPVLDASLIAPVDRHDPPSAMAEAARLRDETCVFPHCNRPSIACDLDHIEPYVPPDEGGPPGQTSLEALAPLCRRHHRAKTHADFSYRRLRDGSYRWTLPGGFIVQTDPPHRRPQPPR